MTIVDEISKELLIAPHRMKKYISSCPYRYKIYKIPKRNGKGFRTIAQPAKELKHIQKFVFDKYLKDLPVHDACMAYVRKRNIRDNAERHLNSRYLLKMDFKDFFPSIKPKDLIKHIQQHLDWDIDIQDQLSIEKIFFYLPERGGALELSIGAPTSPYISNTIMYDFDSRVHKLCEENGVIYTRYADDISFSTNTKKLLFKFAEQITEILKHTDYPTINVNHDKTVFLSKQANMHITGLVLTNEGKISIGRKKKRYIKSMVYKHIKGLLSSEDDAYLSGYLSYCWSVEADFIKSLERKFGHDVISQLRHA